MIPTKMSVFGLRGARLWKSTSEYPGFDHTSLNAEVERKLRGRSYRLRLSLHVRYGAQLHSLRPEIELEHHPGHLDPVRARRVRERMALPVED